MNRYRFSYVAACALLMITSCSKEGADDDNQTVIIIETPDNETPDTLIKARADAKQLYVDYYEAAAAENSDGLWSGDVANCEPGSVPEATMNKIFTRLSYFRIAAGLNNTVGENSAQSLMAQQTALMMHANQALSHDPPNTWSCYTEEGKLGAGKSLLTTTKDAAAVDSYIRDRGADNFAIGHRRWLLWPKLQEIGVGNTSGYNALWVIGNGGPSPADAPEFIAWPPEGFTPKRVAYPRWSFSIPKADFKDATVRMALENGEKIELSIEEQVSGFGDPTLVWVPNINPFDVEQDITYDISIENVVVGEETKTFTYRVRLFDINS